MPERLRRPRAKGELREQAVLMRRLGRTDDDIALDLGVSKSSLSRWLRTLAPAAPEGDGLLVPDDVQPAGVPGDVREATRELRLGGGLLKEIAAAHA